MRLGRITISNQVSATGPGDGMHETSTAPPLTWSCAFPATPAQAREARRSLARILDGHPAADDAVLCLSDLARI